MSLLLTGIEAEEAIVEFYHKPSEAPGPPAYLFGSKLITKEDALTCLSILDFIGYDSTHHCSHQRMLSS